MTITPVSAYCALLRLYPRRFRDEYGADMALLFANQMRDEPAARVWIRSVVDLAIAVPTQHLEAHMNRAPTPLVPVLFAGIGVSGLGVAIIGGSGAGMLLVGVTLAVVALGFAAVAWRGARPIGTHALTPHWWKFIANGASALAAVAGATTLTGEVDESMWWPTMITVVCAVTLLGTGLVLGIAHRTVRPRPTSV